MSVELVEHLVGIVDGCQGFVGTGVDHPGPVVGPVGDRHPELQGSEAGTGVRVVLEKIPDFLVDGDTVGPACGGVRAALDVSGEEFNAGEEAADPTLVTVAVAPDLVAESLQHEHALLEPGQGLEDGLELFEWARFILPEIGGQGSVGRENNDETLPAGSRFSRLQAGEAGYEGQGGGRETEVTEKVTAVSHHDWSWSGSWESGQCAASGLSSA